MTIDEFFFYLALLAYLVGALHYLLYVVKPNQHIGRVATAATLAGFAAHSLSHVFRIYALRRPPLSSPYESLSFLAWAIVLIYLVIELRYRNRIMGAFVLPLALLGNAAFALTFCAGLMYLIQERQLKSRNLGRLNFRLPSLELLDDVAFKSILFGFPLLTLALISGSLWAEHARGSFFTWRPREVWSVVSWVIYAGLVYARVSAGWRGRKAALLAILGFCLVLFTFIGVKVFFKV